MKRLIMVFVFAAALAPSSYAQVDIDMGRVTCGELLALPEARQDFFAAWMSGWINQKANRTQVDLIAFRKNIASVKSWCAYNKRESVMRGLYDALGIKN